MKLAKSFVRGFAAALSAAGSSGAITMNSYSKSIATTSMAALGAINIACAADLPSKASPAPFVDRPFFFIVDNRLTYAYDYGTPSPGFGGVKTNRQVLAFTHFDAWDYGTNAIDVGVVKFDHNRPANPCTTPGTGTCDGATAPYAVMRSTLGINEIFNTKAFSMGPLRNVSFEFGAGYTSINDFAQLQTQHAVAGLQFAFNLPYKGYLNIAPMVHGSWYQSPLAAPGSPLLFGLSGVPGGHLDYSPAWTVEVNYYMDLGFLPETIPLSISGRGVAIGPKGTGYSAGLVPAAVLPPTKTELNLEPIRLTLDASKVASGAKYSHLVDVWVAYKYRQNILGLDNKIAPLCAGSACTGSSVYSGVTAKF